MALGSSGTAHKGTNCPKLIKIMDYACTENDRNPVYPVTGRTLTLGSDGKPSTPTTMATDPIRDS